ncbi:MAG TPA: hypothetical protein VJV79_40325 [Polyangiaceae bacterium]|nr:hypothetical protein [Polyangiaceae bacterium]
MTDLEPGFVIPQGDLDVMRRIATSTTGHLDDLRTFLANTKA